LNPYMMEVGQAFVAQARTLLSTDYLPKIERCLAELTDDDLWWRADRGSNSIGNLILHLSGNARQWIVCGIGGTPDSRERQKEFDALSGLSRGRALAVLKQTITEVDSVLAGVSPTDLLEPRLIQGSQVTVLEAIFHVVEHFSMHTGQIILLTKMLTKSDLRFYDFSTGEPLPTWREPEISPEHAG
jgi:uncharacterized damage-inducible protein DinB